MTQDEETSLRKFMEIGKLIQDYADLEIAREREACAELCDYVYENIVTDEHIKDMAFKIRARGEQA